MSRKVQVKVINDSDFDLPQKATSGSVALDLRADLFVSSPAKYNYGIRIPLLVDKDEKGSFVTVYQGDRVLISSGLKVELPEGYGLFIIPRSGLALKHGITIPNSPGLIDYDYRGHIGITIINMHTEPFKVYHGDRLAQMFVLPVPEIEWVEASELSDTARGAGGFGHSKIN